ncbi:MAG TPA: DUF4433 domain-containing protein [Acidimicrobiales bacterium]|nr:DUF4433 domain-containing protein [Acidimicrobiales bacterium]
MSTRILHFTHQSNLPSIVEHGLLSDTRAQGTVAGVEVGKPEIKTYRRETEVRVGPGGVVSDYVPFYFAPRSPMMYVIHRGAVPGLQGGSDMLVYLTTTIEGLVAGGGELVVTDRNAVLAYADQTDDLERLDDIVDWELMRAMFWNDTPEEPDRKERRMAECLVHGSVPWTAIDGIVTKTAERSAEVSSLLADAPHRPPVAPTGDWYF